MHKGINFILVHRSEKLLGQKDINSQFTVIWGHLIIICNLSHQDPERKANLHS
jgi:hypothetical protein